MQSRLQFWLTPYEFREALENPHALIQHVRNLHPLAWLFSLRLNTPRNTQKWVNKILFLADVFQGDGTVD